MIKENLVSPDKNITGAYLPLRTKPGHYKFNWDAVIGYFVHFLYKKKFDKNNIELFKEQCKNHFLEKLDESDFWPVLEKMYFEGEQLFQISPELFVFNASKGGIDTNSKNLGDMYVGLLNGFSLPSPSDDKLNFLEKDIKLEFDKFCHERSTINSHNYASAYLPFLSELFKKDLSFLNNRPHYFLSKSYEFIRLYGLLYISQMSLNIKNWADGKPGSKPCYFIIDNEKASEERALVRGFGYNQLHEHLEYLFPYLVMNETLQNKEGIKPLWQLFDDIRSEVDIASLNEFGRKFVQDRNQRKYYVDEQFWQKTADKKEIMDQLLKLSYIQFDRRKGTLSGYNEAPVKGTLGNILDPFIQKRGRAGQVLTFNQDYVVLLTNLAIGERDKLRFHELLNAFKERGVYFDKQSQQVLVEFYERMGNVERMSDSGDAVYVRKTV